jgi:hypothetical protein
LHLTIGANINNSVRSLRKNGIVSIIEEKAVSHTLSPPHKSLGLNLKRDVLVSFHHKEFLILGGQEFLCLFVKCILGRGSSEVEG